MLSRRIAAFLLVALLLAVPAVASSAPTAPLRSAVSWSGVVGQVRAFLANLLPSFGVAGAMAKDGAVAPGTFQRSGNRPLTGNGGPLCNTGTMDPNGSCSQQ
jgi:hypothetical protein